MITIVTAFNKNTISWLAYGSVLNVQYKDTQTKPNHLDETSTLYLDL
jgi:hypothetical protein